MCILGNYFELGPPKAPCYMIKSILKIARYCPLVIQGFSFFLGLFQVIMATPVETRFFDVDVHLLMERFEHGSCGTPKSVTPFPSHPFTSHP